MMKISKSGKYAHYSWRYIKLRIGCLSFFLVCSLLSIDAKTPVKPKYLPLGVCQKVENCQMVKKLGFDYMECSVSDLLTPTQSVEAFRTKLDLIKKSGIEIYSCNSFIPASMRCVGPDAVPDKIMEFATTALRRAKEAGIKIIVFGSGASRKIPDGFDRQTAQNQFVDLLKMIAPVAKENGVTIAIEPLNRKETNFINSVTEACDIAKVVDHKSIRVLADFYHMNMENESAESLIKAGKLLVHCHVAETVKRAAPGVSDESFIPFFNALKKINYKGRLSIECGWTDFEKQAPEAIRVLKAQQDLKDVAENKVDK